MENRAKGSAISFFIGLLVGFWPIRWGALAATFFFGFFVAKLVHIGAFFNTIREICGC